MSIPIPDWQYRNKQIKTIKDFPKNTVGFVYEITFSNQKKYIGKKVLQHKHTLKPLKGKKRKRITFVESDWKSYWGSIKDKLHTESVKGGILKITERKILKICYTKTDLTYFEVKYQFSKNVLESEIYLNSNILGKFYKRCK